MNNILCVDGTLTYARTEAIFRWLTHLTSSSVYKYIYLYRTVLLLIGHKTAFKIRFFRRQEINNTHRKIDQTTYSASQNTFMSITLWRHAKPRGVTDNTCRQTSQRTKHGLTTRKHQHVLRWDIWTFKSLRVEYVRQQASDISVWTSEVILQIL